MSNKERLQILNLPSLKGRRLRGDLIELYKINNNLVDIDFNELFTVNKYDKTRNKEGKIFLQHYNTNIRKYSFTNRASPHWNALPYSVKFATNLNTFKKSS